MIWEYLLTMRGDGMPCFPTLGLIALLSPRAFLIRSSLFRRGASWIELKVSDGLLTTGRNEGKGLIVLSVLRLDFWEPARKALRESDLTD